MLAADNDNAHWLVYRTSIGSGKCTIMHDEERNDWW